MNRADALNQIRRTLLLGARQGGVPGNTEQLELPLLAQIPPSSSPRESADPDLDRIGAQLHEFLLDLTLLIQMEVHGLVTSPLQRRRRRLRLGAAPSLRFLQEWQPGNATAETTAPASAEAAPVTLETATVAQGRDAYYHETLSHAQELASQLDLAFTLVEEMSARLFPLAQQATAQDDLAGLVLGHGLRHRLTRTPRGRFTFSVDRERSRRSGVFLTPPELVRELLDAVLRPIEPDTKHVLDPACGSGQFLMGAASRLLGASGVLRESPERLEVLHRIWGVDLDPSATRIAAHNLVIWALERLREAHEEPAAAGRRNGPATQVYGEVLDRVFPQPCPYVLGTQVQTGNALLNEPSSFSPGFQWSKRFPQVFDRDDPGFDVVIGNPPWVSYGLRDRAAADEEERTYFERKFPQGTQYKLTLYPLFIELALRLTRDGGCHGFLVPDSVLTGHHFSKIRKHLLSSTFLYELSLIEAAPWPGAQVGYTVIYAAQKKAPGVTAPATVRNRVLAPIRPQRGRAKNRGLPPGLLESLESARGTGPSAAPGVAGHSNGFHTSGETQDTAAKRTSITLPGIGNGPTLEGSEVWVPSSRFKSGRGSVLRIFRDTEEIDFLECMQGAGMRMRDVAWTYSGLIARFGQKTVQSRRAESRFLLRDRRGQEVILNEDAARHWNPALLSGSEVTPYRVTWGGGRVYLADTREQLARIFKSGFDLDRYRRPKVFLRQTGDRLIAALDRDGYFCMNNLHLIGGKPDYRVPPLLLVGLLMSEPIQRTYRIYALEGSRPLAQVDLKTVESLPYPTDVSGHPVGAGDPPPRTHPQSRKVLRFVDRSLKNGSLEQILKLVGRARDTGERPFEEGPLRGRDVLTLALTRVMEYQETWARSGFNSGKSSRKDDGAVHFGDLQNVIDAVFGLLFRVAVRV